MSTLAQSPEAESKRANPVLDARNDLVGLYNLGQAGLLEGWDSVMQGENLHLLRPSKDISMDNIPGDEIVINLGYGPNAVCKMTEVGRWPEEKGIFEYFRTYSIDTTASTVSIIRGNAKIKKTFRISHRTDVQLKTEELLSSEEIEALISNIYEIKNAASFGAKNKKLLAIGQAATSEK